MKTVVRDGIWKGHGVSGASNARDQVLPTYNLGQPRQSREQSMGSVSLAVNAVKDEHETKGIRASMILEHLGQVDGQLGHGLAPRWCGIPG